MRLAAWLSALVWIAGCAHEQPPEIPEGPVAWSVSASSTTREVQVGDDFTFTLALTHPPDGDFVTPSEAEFEPFDVLDTWTEEVSPIETKLHFRLAAYQLPEDLEVAPLTLRYRDADSAMARVETEPVAVRVVTSLTPEVTDIHDIKDPVGLEVPRDWSMLAWLLLALVLAVVAYLIYRKFRKDTGNETAPEWVAPPRPPHEEAEAALARLAEKELIEKGELALFYTELTDIMKRYAGRHFEIPYLERTSEEVLSDLAAKEVSAPPLRAILEVADLVKFAKQMPGEQQGRSSLTMAVELVRDTRPPPMEMTTPEPVS